MKKAIPFSSFTSNAHVKSPLLLLSLSPDALFSNTSKMSLDKPDGFCFRWSDYHRQLKQQPEHQLSDSLRMLEINKPMRLTTTTATTTTTVTTIPSDPPPLGPYPGSGPDFPGPPMPPPPIPDIPLNPPRNPPPKPPDEVPPQDPPQKVPPPQYPPVWTPPVPPDV